MEISHQRLAEVHVVNLVKVCIGDDKEHAALNVRTIKGEANSQQCGVDLFHSHKVVVRHMCEFLEDLLHHANMLVKDITNVSHRLANLLGLSTLSRLLCGAF